MSITSMKTGILAALAAVGSIIATSLGGWDTAMQVLIAVMTADIITGLIVAIVWKRSGKTATGAASSQAMFKGLCRKGVMLLIVWMAVNLDSVMGLAGVIRTAVILYFIGNEGLSVVENAGIMGVPLPKIITNAFEQLKDKNDDPKDSGGEA